MVTETLQELGFSKKEAKIYMSSLELGSAAVSTISTKSGEHRVSTYSILKELKKKGFASEITKNNIKYYSVVSPQDLLKKQQEKISRLSSVMPELIALGNSHSQDSKIYFYEGTDRLKDLFGEIVDEGDYLQEPFLSFLGTTNIDPEFEKYLTSGFIAHRNSQVHPTKVIMADVSSQYAKKMIDMHDTLIIDDPIFDMGNEIVIYGGKVAVLSYNKNEIYGLVIESKILASG